MKKNIKHIPPSQIVKLEETENISLQSTYSIKECVEKFADNSTGSSAIKVSDLHSSWEKIVGSDISQHVHIKHIKDNILYISADHPAWLTQIKYLQNHIIENTNNILGEGSVTSVTVSTYKGQ